MARRTAALPSLDYLESLAEQAAAGNNDALDQLGRENAKLGRRLNQRMRELERSGQTGDAYKRIANSLGKNRASQAKTGSAEQLYKDAKKALSGLNYKESTLSGIADVEEQTANSFMRTMGLLGDDESLSASQVRRINDFLATSGWAEIRKVYGSNTDQAQAMADRIANDEDADDLLQAMQDFDSEETSIFELLDDWGIEF